VKNPITNPRPSPLSADKPDERELVKPSVPPLSGFITLGQAMFRSVGMANKARKENGEKPE
jgi:hypothetical protein